MQAREFRGGPLELSYHLLSNLPVDDDVRQQLLEANSGAAHAPRSTCRAARCSILVVYGCRCGQARSCPGR
jgi:hypothetical protein